MSSTSSNTIQCPSDLDGYFPYEDVEPPFDPACEDGTHNAHNTHERPALATIGAAEFLALEYPPLAMVVEGLIPAGLILLAASPKAGKSLLMMDLAISVATGEPAWGRYPVERGDVLYLALEGGDRSFHTRLRQMTANGPLPANMDLVFNAVRLGEGLEGQVETWLHSKENPRMVVIDTLAKASKGITGQQADDYGLISGLAEVATRFQDTLIVIVCHTRKAYAEDVQDMIAGSNGLTGATDGNAVLTRHTASNRARFYLRPRNAEEADLLLERDSTTLRYFVVGEDEKSQLSSARQNILDLFGTHDTIGTQEVVTALGGNLDTARKHLSDMAKDGLIRRISRGVYGPTSAAFSGDEGDDE